MTIERVANVTGDAHCVFCCEHPGWVFVGWSGVGTDEMAPCPKCERGEKAEFPETPRGRYALPWTGRGGYWQGRSTEGVGITCRCAGRQTERRLAAGPAPAQEPLTSDRTMRPQREEGL
jgi:hypothetical protein